MAIDIIRSLHSISFIVNVVSPCLCGTPAMAAGESAQESKRDLL